MSFVAITVEPHEALPDGCSMRFKAHGESRPIARLRYESDDGTGGIWTVLAVFSDGREAAAFAVPVEDSSAGSSNLVYGGDYGLRLTSVETGAVVAEPFLLLSDASIDVP